MSKPRMFPTFHFEPAALKMEVTHLQHKYKDRDHVSERRIAVKLPDLLQQIRNLKDEQEAINHFSKGLKSIDINILASQYPYENENPETIDKVMIILFNRYNRMVGRRFWRHYQHQPSDDEIVKMLQHAFSHEGDDFLGFNPSLREAYNDVFSAKDSGSVFQSLVNKIGNEQKNLDDNFKLWKIEEDSTLANKLWLSILEHYITELGFLNAQNMQTIQNKLNNINMDHYKRIIVNYLEAFHHEDYHSMLFQQVIERLRDPREDFTFWTDMPRIVIEKVKMRLVQSQLSSFFDLDSDSERFNYWKKYVQYIDFISIVDEPPIAAMYFEQFVVVEFANKGNAAYFYERDGFQKYLVKKLKEDVHESELKDRDAVYFIHKLNHSGHWPSRYDQYMINYLRGNLKYNHQY